MVKDSNDQSLVPKVFAETGVNFISKKLHIFLWNKLLIHFDQWIIEFMQDVFELQTFYCPHINKNMSSKCNKTNNTDKDC